MADNVTLNAGSAGAELWTDEIPVSLKHAQVVKLADGTADSTTVIAAGNGVHGGALRVTLASDSTGQVKLAAGTAEIGKLAAGTASIGVVDLGATDNAVLDAIAASVAGTLTVGSHAVTNAGTFATQATLQAGTAEIGKLAAGTASIGVVDLGATDNAVLDAIAASVAGTLTVGSHAVTNAGTFAVQVDGSALTALQLLDDPIFADDAAFTLGSSKVSISGAIRDDSLTTLTAIEGDAVPLRVSSTGALHVTGGGGGTEYNEDVATPATITGTATMMERDDALGTLTPIEGDWAAMRCNARGALWVEHDTTTAIPITDNGGSLTVDGTVTANLSATDNAVLDAIEANNSPGASHYRNIDANAEAEIKGSAGTLHWLHAMNLTAAKAYLHLYDNTAASVTPGTTTPDFTFALPTQGDTNGAGFNLPLGGQGQAFANGITLVCTTTLDGSTGDPGTNGVIVNAGYT